MKEIDRVVTRKFACAATLLMFTCGGMADAAIVSWTTAGGQTITTDVNTISFNDATLTFASGFFANQLLDVTDTGTSFGSDLAAFHNHSGVAQTVTLDLLVDGNWQTVWSNFNPVSDNIYHGIDTSIPTPISFTGGMVTALRFTSDPNANQTFHGFDSTLQFNFQTTQAVPEPTTLTMFGLGAVGLSLIGYRRRKLAS